MITDEAGANAYINAVNEQYQGVTLSVEKQRDLYKRIRGAGVPKEIADSWVDNRPSFDVDSLDPRYFTDESGARQAGAFEQFKTLSMTDADRDKLREKGIEFPQPSELIGNVAGEAALATGQIASMSNPATAAMTLREIGVAAANQAFKVAVGSTAKQAIKSVSSGNDFDTGKVAADTYDAGALGLLPTFTTPFIKGKWSRAIGNGVVSGIFGASQSLGSSALRGEEADPANMAIAGGLSGLGGFAGGYASKAEKEASVAAKNFRILTEAGIEAPPLGIVDPSYSAKLKAATQSSQAVRDDVERVSKTLKDSIINKTGGFGALSEPSVLTEEVSKLSGKISGLTTQAEEAASKTASAALALSGKEVSANTSYLASAKEIMDKNYANAVSSVKASANAAIDGFLGAFTTKQFNEATGGFGNALTAAEARRNVKEVAKASYDTFKGVSNELFNAVPEGSFKSDRITQAMDSSIDLAPVEVKNMIKAALKNIPQEVDEAGGVIYGEATKQQWLNVRNALNDSIGANARAPSPSDHWLGKAASAITEQMDAQKVAALGKKGAARWDEARKYYRSIESFHDTDVRTLLFGSNESTPLAKTLLNDISENGVGAESRYGRLVKSLKSHGNEQLFKQHEAMLNDTIKSYIFDVSTTPEGDLSPHLFVKAIGDMRKRPDALTKIGFGNQKSINLLDDAIQKYPEASKLTPQQVETLMALPGANKSLGQVKALNGVLQDLAIQHAESKIGKAVAFEAMGNTASARKAMYEARQAVSSAGLQESKINQALIKAKGDPIYQSFANVNVSPDSYDSLYQTFFNPASGKVSNNDIKIMLTSLTTGNKEQQQLAGALRTRFLNDAMMKAKGATRSNEEAVTLFAEALTPSDDKSSLYQRALSMFTKPQLAELKKDYGAAKIIESYNTSANNANRNIANTASVAGPAIGTASGVAPIGGSLTGLFRGVGGLISDGKYQLVNFAYSTNPERFIKSKNATAEAAKYISNLNFAQRHQFYVQNKEVADTLGQQQESPQ